MRPQREEEGYGPLAFAEQGVAMLSSVLNSERAVQLRELLSTHKDLARKPADLEKKYDAQFSVVFEAIRELMIPPEPRKRPIACLPERQRRQGVGAKLDD